MNKNIINQDIEEIHKALGNKIYQLEGKNILITGGYGMLGRYLIYTIIYANKQKFKKKTSVYVVVRSKKEIFGNDKYIHYVHADITKPLPSIKNIHYIIHAASKAAPKNYIKEKVDTLNTNILGLYNLLALQTKSLESFLYFSSGEIYGGPKETKPIQEDYIGIVDHLNERSCYIEGKRAGETICMNYFWEKRLPIKIARIFHTFGPGLNITDGRVFSDLIKNGIEKKDIDIKGDATIKRPFLYLKDATVMFFLLLLSDKNGGIYNISNDKNIVSVGEFARFVCSEFNKYYNKKLTVNITKNKKNAYYKHAVKTIRPSIAKFKRDFKYSPSTTVEEAVKKTVAYYIGKD